VFDIGWVYRVSTSIGHKISDTEGLRVHTLYEFIGADIDTLLDGMSGEKGGKKQLAMSCPIPALPPRVCA